jgi:hypothetical protein
MPVFAKSVEPRSVEQVLIEPIGELAVIDATAESAADIAEGHPGIEAFLGISQQKTFAEIVQCRAFFEAEIGRRHRAAGHA